MSGDEYRRNFPKLTSVAGPDLVDDRLLSRVPEDLDILLFDLILWIEESPDSPN